MADRQQPDAKGHVFPVTETQGSAIIRNTVAGTIKTADGATLPAPITLVAAGGTFSVQTATCGTTCMTCCGFSGQTVMPSNFSCPVGGSVQCSFSMTDCNGGTSGFSALWTSSDTTVMTVNSSGVATGVAPGSCTIVAQSSGSVVVNTGQICSGTGSVSCQQGNPGAGTGGFVPGLTCGATSGTQGGVTRGSIVNCTVNNLPSGGTVSNWTFTDGTNTVTAASNTRSSWSGTAVQAGTVSVKVPNGTISTTLSAALTVNARNWHTNPASPVEVANGTLVTLPVPPQPSGTDSGLGFFREVTGDSGANSTTIGSGPNTGYAYWATQLSISTTFQYEINPDLEDSTSTFSVHQCGNFNATTNPGGFISWSNLITQTKRHEFNSSTQSHFAFYSNSINSSANNSGDFFEQQVAAPGTNLTTWAQGVMNGLKTRYDQIGTASAVEPFPVNQSETGTFLGNINYAPYTSCP